MNAMVQTLQFRPIADKVFVGRFIASRWGTNALFMSGWVRPASEVEAIGAYQGEELLGLATWSVTKGIAAIYSLDSLAEGRGVGRRLIDAVAAAAQGRSDAPAHPHHERQPSRPWLPAAPRLSPHHPLCRRRRRLRDGPPGARRRRHGRHPAPRRPRA